MPWFLPIILSATLPPAERLVSAIHQAETRADAPAAAQAFDELEAMGFGNGLFYFKQGNAHMQAGDLARAILAYRRAARVLPRSKDLQQNLAEARRLVIDPPGTNSRPWHEWMPPLNTQEQYLVALACWLLGWCLAILRLYRESRLITVAAWTFIVLALLLAATAWASEYDQVLRPIGVVREDAVPLRTGNGNAYPPLQDRNGPVRVNRGVEIRVLHERPNGWLRVELANGLVGWLPRSAVLVDDS